MVDNSSTPDLMTTRPVVLGTTLRVGTALDGWSRGGLVGVDEISLIQQQKSSAAARSKQRALTQQDADALTQQRWLLSARL